MGRKKKIKKTKKVKKRKQAIKDMLSMCQVALSETSLVKQSEIIKDEIFYYFNAKYIF